MLPEHLQGLCKTLITQVTWRERPCGELSNGVSWLSCQRFPVFLVVLVLAVLAKLLHLPGIRLIRGQASDLLELLVELELHLPGGSHYLPQRTLIFFTKSAL